MPYLLGLFLAAHGLIHLSYLSPRPADALSSWPFEMARSWAVTGLGLDVGLVRAAGIALMALVVAGYVVAALAAAGIAVPESWWRVSVLVASVASIAMLGLFFHPWIVLGFAIDAALLWLVFVQGWNPAAAFGR